jgi:hypothetical protein
LTREEIQREICKAAEEGLAHIIVFIFGSLKATGKSNTIKKPAAR